MIKNKFLNKFKSKHGFTLVEMLIAVFIVGIVMTLSIVYVRGAYFKAKDAQALYNVKQLQTALLLYYADFGVFPDGTLVMNIDGMCLTENGFEVCSGPVAKDGFIKTAQAVNSDHASFDRIYLKDIPKSVYSDTDSLYVADQGGQWYTVVYKTKDEIKRAYPEDRKDSYLLSDVNIRNWRIKTDLADIANMMNDFYQQNGAYPRIEACFRNNKGCILNNGDFIQEKECLDIETNAPDKIYYKLATISDRNLLGNINYCITNNTGNDFYIEYDLETHENADSAKKNLYKKHFKDYFSGTRVVDNGNGSVFNHSFSKAKLESTGDFHHEYWTDFFKFGAKKATNSDHSIIKAGRKPRQ